MEVRIEQHELKAAMQIVSRFPEKRSRIPILCNVLIRPRGDGVEIAATDQEVAIRYRSTTGTVSGNGVSGLCVNAQQLTKAVKGLSGEITLADVETNVSLATFQTSMKLTGLPAEDYPALHGMPEGAPGWKMDAATFGEMLRTTEPAMSRDATRVNLNGTFFEYDGKGTLKVTTTDGHRLSSISRPVQGGSTAVKGILPRKASVEFRKAFGRGDDVSICIDKESTMHVTRDNVHASARLVEGEFPDYKQVIPKPALRARVLAGELLDMLGRVLHVASERTHGVKFEFSPGSLRAVVINPDLGDASEQIPADYDGEAFAIGFNGRYVTDFLKLVDDSETVTLGFGMEKDEKREHHLSPMTIRRASDPDTVHVIMPMRI